VVDVWRRDVPLLLPRMSLKTPFKPKRFRKYHESALIESARVKL
jgi:hypothetical protein